MPVHGHIQHATHRAEWKQVCGSRLAFMQQRGLGWQWSAKFKGIKNTKQNNLILLTTGAE